MSDVRKLVSLVCYMASHLIEETPTFGREFEGDSIILEVIAELSGLNTGK